MNSKQTLERIAAALEGIEEHLRKMWELEASRQLLNAIGSDAVREDRSCVLNYQLELKAISDVRHVPEQDLLRFLRVAVSLDRIGYLVTQDLIPPRALFEWQEEDILLCWKKLKPVVMYMREESNPPRPKYCKHFERLATDWLENRKG